MADGLFYVDSRTPFMSGDAAAITAIGTYVALVPVANLPVLGSNYFSYVGKAVRIRMFGRMSSAAAPGTMVFSYLWGTGANASGNGNPLASTAAITPAVSLVAAPWMWEVVIRCRTLGTSGTLMATGFFSLLNSTTSTTAATTFICPAVTPAGVTADTTAANVLSPQVIATTSITNTVTVHDFLFEALN